LSCRRSQYLPSVCEKSHGKNEDKKISQDLLQIHHQKRKVDLRFARFLQPRLHKSQAVATFALPEFAFYGIPFTRFFPFLA
jgi:hypothetical protein